MRNPSRSGSWKRKLNEFGFGFYIFEGFFLSFRPSKFTNKPEARSRKLEANPNPLAGSLASNAHSHLVSFLVRPFPFRILRLSIL